MAFARGMLVEWEGKSSGWAGVVGLGFDPDSGPGEFDVNSVAFEKRGNP